MTVSPWCVRSLGIRRAIGGPGGAPAGWPGGVAAIVVEATARVGLLLTRAVYGRRRPGQRPRPGLAPPARSRRVPTGEASADRRSARRPEKRPPTGEAPADRRSVRRPEKRPPTGDD